MHIQFIPVHIPTSHLSNIILILSYYLHTRPPSDVSTSDISIGFCMHLSSPPSAVNVPSIVSFLIWSRWELLVVGTFYEACHAIFYRPAVPSSLLSTNILSILFSNTAIPAGARPRIISTKRTTIIIVYRHYWMQNSSCASYFNISLSYEWKNIEYLKRSP